MELKRFLAHDLKRVMASTLVLLLLTVLSTACAAKQKTEGAQEYPDDSVISEKVKTAILKDPTVNVRQINIETYKGVVQITGAVDTREEARKISNIAAEIAGVVSVKNDLIVR